MSVDERVTNLEIRLAYQDEVIAALDEVVRDFAARVERLERQQREREALAKVEEPIGPPDEPPPHY